MGQRGKMEGRNKANAESSQSRRNFQTCSCVYTLYSQPRYFLAEKGGRDDSPPSKTPRLFSPANKPRARDGEFAMGEEEKKEGLYEKRAFRLKSLLLFILAVIQNVISSHPPGKTHPSSRTFGCLRVPLTPVLPLSLRNTIMAR